MSVQGLPWLIVIEQPPCCHTCSYLKYELITEFLDKIPVDQHGNIMTMHLKKKRAFEVTNFRVESPQDFIYFR